MTVDTYALGCPGDFVLVVVVGVVRGVRYMKSLASDHDAGRGGRPGHDAERAVLALRRYQPVPR
ncbi:MAG: hypothetical protein ACLPXU_02290, partial [Acidimicrobiales bacterium]